MSTPQSWSTVIDHGSDAAFRTWAAEFIAKMLATGTLTQTADTGQINTATVTRAGTNSNAGYASFYLNDSLHGTAPVYFRVDFGTGAATNAPRIQITVGTGMNGSGTVTGTALTSARTCTATAAPTSTVTTYNSYMCAAPGFFGFSWKGGAGGSTNAARGSFFFCRTVDSAGAISAQGGYCFWGAGVTNVFAYQSLRFASTAAAYTAVTTPTASIPCVIPGAVTSSLVGANNQAYLHFAGFPDVQALFGLATAITSEVAVGNTFTMAPIAGVSHTYINLGAINPSETTGATGTYGQCMLWE
jgi:hypothetical protein